MSKGDRIIPYKEAATQIRDLVGVFDSILGLLRPKTLKHFLTVKDQEVEDEAPAQVDQGYAHLAADDKNLQSFQFNIKEYSTIKHIMENNSDFIRPTPESQRVKVIDCQVMNAML